MTTRVQTTTAVFLEQDTQFSHRVGWGSTTLRIGESAEVTLHIFTQDSDDRKGKADILARFIAECQTLHAELVGEPVEA